MLLSETLKPQGHQESPCTHKLLSIGLRLYYFFWFGSYCRFWAICIGCGDMLYAGGKEPDSLSCFIFNFWEDLRRTLSDSFGKKEHLQIEI